MHIGKLIREYGGSAKRLGVSQEYLDALRGRFNENNEYEPPLIEHASLDFIIRFLKEYRIEQRFSEIDLAPVQEDGIWTAFEKISGNQNVIKKIKHGVNRDDALQLLKQYYFDVKGSDQLTTIIANIPRYAAWHAIEFGGLFASEPEHEMALSNTLWNPSMRMDTMTPTEFTDKTPGREVTLTADGIEFYVNPKLLPRNVKEIKTRNFYGSFKEGRERGYGYEFNQVSIVFKKDIPQKVMNEVHKKQKEAEFFGGLKPGDRGDFITEKTFAGGSEDHYQGQWYTGTRPAFKIIRNNELVVYYSPMELGEQTINGGYGIYAPLPRTLDLLKTIQNKWLYNRT